MTDTISRPYGCRCHAEIGDSECPVHVTCQECGVYVPQVKTFDKVGADRLADEVDILVWSKRIDARSPAADALLDYRQPPMSPRSERIRELERENEMLRKQLAKLTAPGILPAKPGPKRVR